MPEFDLAVCLFGYHVAKFPTHLVPDIARGKLMGNFEYHGLGIRLFTPRQKDTCQTQNNRQNAEFSYDFFHWNRVNPILS
jgi:hypothetical protein